MTPATLSIFRKGATALITGAASGIGLATAQRCYSHGMNLVLLDRDATRLSQITKHHFPPEGTSTITTHVIDVSSRLEWQQLAPQIKSSHPQGIDFLMLNAGAGFTPQEGKTFWDDAEYFEKTFAVNTMGYTNGLAALLDSVITVDNKNESERAIVLTGSKQGITNPPSNPAYNASKAAVRTLAEHLSFDMAKTAPNVSVHLLIPGWTYTGFHTAAFREKPPGAWTSKQVVDFMVEKMAEKRFYILCPDNEVSEELDRKRVTPNIIGPLLKSTNAPSNRNRKHPIRSQKYIFFAPPPSPDFYTPAWIASDDVNNETVWNVHTTAYLYAEIFNLVFKDGDLKLQETGENAESLNTFTVVTKELPKDNKTYVLAFGKRQQPDDPEDLGPVHACAAIPVKQNNSQDVTPIIQLHASNIPTAPGDLINYNDFKENSAHINFAAILRTQHSVPFFTKQATTVMLNGTLLMITHSLSFRLGRA
ncbi:hypothetical protein CBS147352_1918 [Aspergillus niger]|nr:hypothetical protein CBS147352_1918 [Aspergillus niger]